MDKNTNAIEMVEDNEITLTFDGEYIRASTGEMLHLTAPQKVIVKCLLDNGGSASVETCRAALARAGFNNMSTLRTSANTLASRFPRHAFPARLSWTNGIVRLVAGSSMRDKLSRLQAKIHRAANDLQIIINRSPVSPYAGEIKRIIRELSE